MCDSLKDASKTENKRATSAAQVFLEESGLTEGNTFGQTRAWTQSREDLQHALERIR
jgi:hypothetical protein